MILDDRFSFSLLWQLFVLLPELAKLLLNEPQVIFGISMQHTAVKIIIFFRLFFVEVSLDVCLNFSAQNARILLSWSMLSAHWNGLHVVVIDRGGPTGRHC